MQNIIAPSILSANFAKLGEEVKNVLKSGADVIHIDVMDNHYVPNITFGSLVCSALRKDGIKATLDVHLMTKPVDQLIEVFAKAGADYITIHPEATQHLDRSLELIKDCGCKIGLALNPATTLSYLDYVIDKLDLILIMTVNPGFGGQKFMKQLLPKIKQVKQKICEQCHEINLAVDGGIKEHNISEIAKAGANFFVVGSAIFGSENYKKTIRALRNKIKSANSQMCCQ